jgi:D-hydroxyproline dehydrogenase subunit beta
VLNGRRPDAVVIGAGVVGAACAYYLARAGLRVEVLEADFAAGGTTAAGMGHIVVMDDSDPQFALTRYSQRLLAELAPELPPQVELERCGTLWVAEDDEQMAAVAAKHVYYGARGVPTEVLDARMLAEAEPKLRPGLAGGLRVPEDGVVYQPVLTSWLLARAAEAGAVLREGVRVERGESGALAADGAPLEAGCVVNAAGAAAPALSPGLPIVPRKGHLAITDRYPGFIRHQLVELGYLKSAHTLTADSVAFNLQPRATGQVLIGSSRELCGWDDSLNRDVLTRMLRRAVEFVPSLAGLSVLRSWTGFRPATPDKLPLIGAWPGTQNLWIAAGHEGLGVTTALATGRILADLVTGRPPEIDAEPYAAARALHLVEA